MKRWLILILLTLLLTACNPQGVPASQLLTPPALRTAAAWTVTPTLTPTATNQPTSTMMTTPTEENGSDDGSGAWLWLLTLGVVGVIVYFVVRSRRRESIKPQS